MIRFRDALRRLFPKGVRGGRIGAVVLVLAVVGGALAYVLTGAPTREVKADFASAVGMYTGSDVRMLGVKIGTVTGIEPRGTDVEISMKVDASRQLPANAIAAIVPPSLVSDRYVQLAPYYTGGPTLADGATIPRERTAVPVELDDIYSALNRLNVALGPNGANKNGALSDLLSTGAANLGGNGTALGQTIGNLSAAVNTLANGRTDLFGTVQNLTTFTKALQDSDGQVRQVNDLLATVSQQLADERGSLAAALKNLSTALTQVATFLNSNQAVFTKDVTDLATVTTVLKDRQAALAEILSVAPVALSNLGHSYNPDFGTLDTRSGLQSLLDPTQICTTLEALDKLPAITLVGGVLQLVPGLTQISNLENICFRVLNQSPTGQQAVANAALGRSLPSLPAIPGIGALSQAAGGLVGGVTGAGGSATDSLRRVQLPIVPGVGS